ncbi:MAG: hypothetical protein M3250_00945 [Thermoproteota archaeon]|nr:hypothetical protein [Thermoproteota archaeon]
MSHQRQKKINTIITVLLQSSEGVRSGSITKRTTKKREEGEKSTRLEIYSNILSLC